MNEIISCVDGIIAKISGRALVSSSEMVDALLDIRLLAELQSVKEAKVLENI
jgi:thymidine phosphorylase